MQKGGWETQRRGVVRHIAAEDRYIDGVSRAQPRAKKQHVENGAIASLAAASRSLDRSFTRSRERIVIVAPGECGSLT